MINEKVFNKLKQIKNQCDLHKYGCDNCIFVQKNLNCRIKEIVYKLCKRPSDWDLEEIKEILKK